LSPISARKMVPKVIQKTCQFMVLQPCQSK
jgi:hypothetical protein